MQASAVTKRGAVAQRRADSLAYLSAACLLVVLSLLFARDAQANFPMLPKWALCNDVNCAQGAPTCDAFTLDTCFPTMDDAFAAWPGEYPFFCGWTGDPFKQDGTYPSERWRRFWDQCPDS